MSSLMYLRREKSLNLRKDHFLWSRPTYVLCLGIFIFYAFFLVFVYKYMYYQEFFIFLYPPPLPLSDVVLRKNCGLMLVCFFLIFLFFLFIVPLVLSVSIILLNWPKPQVSAFYNPLSSSVSVSLHPVTCNSGSLVGTGLSIQHKGNQSPDWTVTCELAK